MSIENMRQVGPRTYIVWTQAGFKKALREAQEGDRDGRRVRGYPTQYPSLVTFSFEYRGYHYWAAKCVPFNEALDEARKYLDRLETANREHRAALGARTPSPLWKRILGVFQ